MQTHYINQIINNTIEGILIIEEGFIKNVNKPFMDILSYKDENELIGNLAIGILIPTSKNNFIEYNTKIFQEISLINKDGKIIPAIIKIKDLDIDGNICKMVSVLDLTDIKKNEKLLLEQSKLAAMGEMLSIISHQWRQPLSAIGSILTRLKLKYNLKNIDLDTYDKNIDEINKYVQYMSNTIDNFRDFFIKDTKKESIRIDNVVNNAYSLIKTSFNESNIKVSINLITLNNIYLYKNDLIQIILNILNNSKDAIIENKIENPHVIINFYEDENTQTIEIEDNAGGINEEIIDEIFNPYFTTKSKTNGTGLGLYICKMIANKYLNGEIKVKNINNGVIFTLVLNK